MSHSEIQLHTTGCGKLKPSYILLVGMEYGAAIVKIQIYPDSVFWLLSICTRQLSIGGEHRPATLELDPAPLADGLLETLHLALKNNNVPLYCLLETPHPASKNDLPLEGQRADWRFSLPATFLGLLPLTFYNYPSLKATVGSSCLAGDPLRRFFLPHKDCAVILNHLLVTRKKLPQSLHPEGGFKQDANTQRK
jgi:hypothetical protein